MAEYVLPVGTKVKTKNKLRCLVGVDMVTLPKGSKGVIQAVNKNSARCYRVKLTGMNADVWLKSYEIEKALW